MLFYLSVLFSCTYKKQVVPQLEVPEKENQTENQQPMLQKSDLPVPQMPQGLPKWEDISPPSSVFQPVAGLALSHDYSQCFKEWFQGDSLPPTIRKFEGRILGKDEKTIGRMIQCPEDRKERLLDSLINKQNVD